MKSIFIDDKAKRYRYTRSVGASRRMALRADKIDTPAPLRSDG